MRMLTLAVFLLLMLVSVVMAETWVPGGNVSGIWDSSGSPYIVEGDLNVIDLQIGPGVSVLMEGDFAIEVSGQLIAEGTEEERILFSVLSDSTSTWNGLLFDGVILGSRMVYCDVEHSDGNGLRINDCLPLIESCRFKNNSGANGGGLYYTNANGGDFSLRYCVIDSNISTAHGGGLRAEITGGTFIIESCTFIGNQANPANAGGSYVGGGAYLNGTGHYFISNSQFSSNSCQSRSSGSSTARGGGLCLIDSPADITNCEFNDNYLRATDSSPIQDPRQIYGSGLNTEGESQVVVSNSIFAYNRAAGSHYYGCGANVRGGNTVFNNCVMSFNQYSGVGRTGGVAEVFNSILWDNGGGTQVYGSIVASYCDIQNAADPASFIIDVNPVFLDENLETLDLRVAGISPCIDTGHPGFEYVDRFFPDAQGGIRNDMGISGGPYAQGLSLPMISVPDVPDDQGGHLQISWDSFPADDLAATDPIEQYLVQVIPTGWFAPVIGWSTIATVPATQAPTYSAIAEIDTTYDASLDSTYNANSTWPANLYRVIGSAAGGAVTYDSNTNIGMARDNIFPAAPNILMSESIDTRMIIQLSVDLEATPDFRQTCIFRGDILSLDPYVFGEATLWDEPCTLYEAPPIVPCTSDSLFHSWTECYESYFYYVARHEDSHGNYGAVSDTLIAQYPSGVEDLPIPAVFSVDQNTPNPFNPTTTIKFNLPQEGEVRLDIFGVRGNRIVTLVNEVLSAGTHQAVWNGRNDQGQKVASGVYFYKVSTPDNIATHRMMLLK